MKPLIGNRERINEAAVFHRKVFEAFGGPKKICTLCGKPGATDAAHVIGRAHLGTLRYVDAGLARPLHRECHRDVDEGRTEWPLHIRRAAVRVHNLYAKIKMREPAA